MNMKETNKPKREKRWEKKEQLKPIYDNQNYDLDGDGRTGAQGDIIGYSSDTEYVISY